LQRPHERHREESKDQVTHATDRRVSICSSDNNGSVETAAGSASVARPEELSRYALEDEDEEEESAVQFDDHKRDPEDALVYGENAESKQHQRDAGFDGHVGEDVEGFAKPPVLAHVSWARRQDWSAVNAHDCGRARYLEANRDLGYRLDVPNMLASAMVHTSDGECDVQNEHDLLFVSVVHDLSAVQRVLPRQLLRIRHPIQTLSVCTDDSTFALRQRSLSKTEKAHKQRELPGHGLQVRWPLCCFGYSRIVRTTAEDA
jgi:hypothetical protein